MRSLFYLAWLCILASWPSYLRAECPVTATGLCTPGVEETIVIDEIETILNEVVEIYLLETLDESRGFCLDIKGYKSNANIDNGLQAHTCYSYQGMVAVDQGFDSKN